jgi:uncharacterized metal-binding protein YceD (DUF177 family)
MALVSDIVDLSQLGLKHGGGIGFEARVHVGDFVFSEQHYKLAEDPALVDVYISRTTSGNVIRLRYEGALEGPCMRCYGDYSMPVRVDTTEIHEPLLDEEAASEYVDGHELDLAGLVRDSIGLTLPTSISSPVDENGVCTDCENSAEQLAKLKDSEEDGGEDAQLDPRWAKLRELEL